MADLLRALGTPAGTPTAKGEEGTSRHTANKRRETIEGGIGSVLLALGLTPLKGGGDTGGDTGSFSVTMASSPLKAPSPVKALPCAAATAKAGAAAAAFTPRARRETVDPAALMEMLAQFRDDDADDE
jgi:hypothetical protein